MKREQKAIIAQLEKQIEKEKRSNESHEDALTVYYNGKIAGLECAIDLIKRPAWVTEYTKG